MKFLQICFIALVFSSQQAYADYLTMNLVLKQEVSANHFSICHGGGCAHITDTAVLEEEWLQATRECQPEPKDAESERVCIANTVGALEKVVGDKTGTNTDRGGTFGNSHDSGQMDCNDEAINTTTYLKLMQQHGLIQFHDVLDIKRRGFFLNRWPHTTAAIRDMHDGRVYAVDAWFYDNGMPAVIVPFELWKTGWKPEDSLAR
jgi:hypothetical protein